ncbi:DUF397 domain-containing protein [Streptomyces violascens]|uniref:DUF397 domain-containing protein n=1 Tax=Streptomyces violascens TaxID=67381 RepID=UPI003647A079
MICKSVSALSVAPAGAWFKSSYSGGEGSACVSVARLSVDVAVRDSKTPEGAAFVVGHSAFAAFVEYAKSV